MNEQEISFISEMTIDELSAEYMPENSNDFFLYYNGLGKKWLKIWRRGPGEDLWYSDHRQVLWYSNRPIKDVVSKWVKGVLQL